MKVSVVIPAYNEAAYIGKCIESIVLQTEKADEIIVVDNNSTDETVDIAKRFSVKIVHEKEQGMIAARNRGFNEAKYELIVRVDSDAILPENYIKSVKKIFEDKHIVGVSASLDYYGLPFYAKSSSFVLFYAKLSKRILGHEVLFGSNLVIRKDIWEKVKHEVCLNDKLVHEDVDLAIHISPYGKIVIDKDLVVQTSSRRMKAHPQSFFIEYPIRLIKTIRAHPQRKVFSTP